MITDSLNQTLAKYSLKTPLQICHFLAQVLHESGAFRFKSEIWGNTPAQQRYDTREDLGNTPEKDGDGYKYRGRGWIQLTGKANYRKASLALGVDFVKSPDLAAEYPYVALLAGWYWEKVKINAIIEKAARLKVPAGETADTVINAYVTKAVNGGYNGLEDRLRYLLKAKKVLKCN